MGSIADLLGDQLPDDWQDKLADQTNTEKPDPTESPAYTAVVTAVLEETGADPEWLAPHLLLDEDLELFWLSLWSVVADVERQLKVTFTDAQVREWVTLGDMIDAAGAA